MQNLSKKKTITTPLYVAGPKTTQKRKGNSKEKKGKKYWTKTLQHDFYFKTTTTVQHKREILNQVRMTL